ncbi:MAG TPA: hypothetical protein VK419_00530 [Bryobacteraceae bacterium]|nr:hypothetical protein [Bryobacteraceae bacterium]
MLSFRRSAALLVAAAGIAAGQPALTTIQDILYSANGMRYNGTMFITWSSFQAGDNSNIATANLTLPIVNGVLNVQLVPTTTASAGAQYNVTFNSAGVNQFTQVWAVPPSTVPLRVRDVLVSQGTVVGPAPLTTEIDISDVTGLQNQLTIRPQQGPNFAIGRTAIIDSSGEIDGASGNLTDCVRVDGSSGPCGSSSGGIVPSYSDDETPSGAINGSNTSFTLVNAPSPPASLSLYLNGLLMTQGIDYTLSGNAISFLTASTPQSGDLLVASYRYANPNNPLGTLTAAQVICSSTGSATSSTTLTQLGSCTIPAGLLGTGDRIEIQVQYSHTGSSTPFTSTITWAGANVFSRSTVSTETAMVGRFSFGILSGAQSWDAQSWGNSLSFAAAVGSATANTTQNLTISFQGAMSATTTDTVNLGNFTVIRYPAQSNP